MNLVRRLRGFVGTAATWGAAFAAVSVVIVGVLAIAGQLPPADRTTIMRGLVSIALRWGIVGAGTGVVFGGSLMLAERRREFHELSSRRFSLWGFGAGAALPLVVAPLYRLVGRSSGGVDWRLALIFSVFCGATGAGVAALSLRIARSEASQTDGLQGRDRAPVS
jgi:hypothetical protein